MMIQPRYPIYIPSKGRWASRLTMRTLDDMSVPYRVIVEHQEYEQYAEVINPDRLIVLDPAYQQDYDACMELQPNQSRGSGPARNFAWEHAMSEGHERHWIIDDNIRWFYRLVKGKRIRVMSGAAIRAMEAFTERYENVILSGPNYHFYVNDFRPYPPFVPNTRIFSCILIRNDAPFRWRGRYNEDVDLSLRVLKAGYCTLQFNAFLQGKTATRTMRGGNTDELYRNGTREKSEMIERLHPDVCRIAWEYNRWHHYCDYRPFKRNKLIRKPDIDIPTEPNEYGMRLVKVGA